MRHVRCPRPHTLVSRMFHKPPLSATHVSRAQTRRPHSYPAPHASLPRLPPRQEHATSAHNSQRKAPELGHATAHHTRIHAGAGAPPPPRARQHPQRKCPCAGHRNCAPPPHPRGRAPAHRGARAQSHQPPRGRSPHLMKPSALTASYSSCRALMLWSIPARVASEISRPSTTCHSPPSEVTGKPKFRPAGTP